MGGFWVRIFGVRAKFLGVGWVYMVGIFFWCLGRKRVGFFIGLFRWDRNGRLGVEVVRVYC